jgi:uncharacterized membrane protein
MYCFADGRERFSRLHSWQLMGDGGTTFFADGRELFSRQRFWQLIEDGVTIFSLFSAAIHGAPSVCMKATLFY